MKTEKEKLEIATKYLISKGYKVIKPQDVQAAASGDLLNTAQAAHILGIAPATLTVWRSTNRRILTYVKVGSQVRYRREDLEKFISANLCNA